LYIYLYIFIFLLCFASFLTFTFRKENPLASSRFLKKLMRKQRISAFETSIFFPLLQASLWILSCINVL